MAENSATQWHDKSEGIYGEGPTQGRGALMAYNDLLF